MRNFENINVNAEIFHSNVCFASSKTVNALSSIYNIDNLDLEEKKIKLAHIRFNDSVNFYENFKKTIDGECTFFKVFDHILDETIGNGIKIFQSIINDIDIAFLLKRNTLDAYISENKAQMVGAYATVDTSHIKIKFDKDEYLFAKERYKGFFKIVETELKKQNKSLILLNYEEFITKSNKNQLNYISEKTKLKIKDKVYLQYPVQDKTTKYSEKIENYEEYKKYILTESEKYKK
jgi:hypothetical protein